MTNKSYFCTVAALISFCCFAPSVTFAGSGGIQMLPPVNPTTGTAQGCVDPSIPSNNLVLTWDGANAIKCSNAIKEDASGNVGVGTATPQATLDVQGEIRPGDSNAACTSNNEGAIRYNSSTKQYEGCVDLSWGPVGAGSLIAVAQPAAPFLYSGTVYSPGFQVYQLGSTVFGSIANDGFKAPASGYYHFETSMGSGGVTGYPMCGDALISSIFINGNRTSDGQNTGATPGGGSCWSGINNTVYMNKGDIAQIMFGQTQSRGPTLLAPAEGLFVTLLRITK